MSILACRNSNAFVQVFLKGLCGKIWYVYNSIICQEYICIIGRLLSTNTVKTLAII